MKNLLGWSPTMMLTIKQCAFTQAFMGKDSIRTAWLWKGPVVKSKDLTVSTMA
jgi:hypothetical protein